MNQENDDTKRDRLNSLNYRVIGLCMEVHRELGPGLLESTYEEALAFELQTAGLLFVRQTEIPLAYKGVSLSCGYRLDFIIEGELILELKAVNELFPIHQAQVQTYLKLQRQPLGLLINFNVLVLKDGIRRIVSGSLFND